MSLTQLGVPTVELVGGSGGGDLVWIEGWMKLRDANRMDATFMTSWRDGDHYWFLFRRDAVRDHQEWRAFRLRRWPMPESKWTKRSLWLAYSSRQGRFAKGHDWRWLMENRPELGRELEVFVGEFLSVFG